MPFRFNRRVNIIPGLRINLGKRGVSLTEGVPGAHVTLGTRGLRTSLGIPGSGLSWFSQTRWPRGRRRLSAQGCDAQPASWSHRHGWLMFIALWFVVAVIGKLFGY